MILRVTDSAAATDVGRVRKANEDSYYVRSPLFVVADGMGGAQAGEVASKIASEAFAAELDESLSPEQRLAEVVKSANSEIHSKSLADPNLQGMGTTLTAVLLGDTELTIAHVGDSRAYRMRNGELTRLTHDHSLVGEMVRRGAISEAEAEVHPQRSILTRALGPESDVEVDTLSHGVKDGDIFLLCSDGLTTMIADVQIAEAMRESDSMNELAEELIGRANAAGGVDNITVVAFAVTSGRGGPAAAGEGGASTDVIDDPSQTIVGAPAVGAGQRSSDDDAPLIDAGAIGARRPETPAAGSNGHLSQDARSRRFARQRYGKNRRSRRWLALGFGVMVLLLAGLGAVVASLNLYFVGVDEHGLITLYRGLPYEGPVGMQLYTKDYVSTVPADRLPPAERAAILDHKLRTRSDALDLMRNIDQRKLPPRLVVEPKSASGP